MVSEGSTLEGFASLADKFDTLDGIGPTGFPQFAEKSAALQDRAPGQWQTDVHGQIAAWPDAGET